MMSHRLRRSGVSTSTIASTIASTMLLLTGLFTNVDAQDVRSAARVSATTIAVSRNAERARSSLDRWIVERYRGSQLLADSVSQSSAPTSDPVLPRIETVRAGAAADTLLAMHFLPRAGRPALQSGPVRIAGSTGTITPLSATVVVRRQFRAPRLPAARPKEGDWRYGWAYLAILPKVGRPLSATTFRGWLLLDAAAVK
ncbi:MAG TPA: hypothetical protein VE869_12180 [Gemmatimonas sp.]|nr:hypothetical protein [Gemmatimonas sp.]